MGVLAHPADAKSGGQNHGGQHGQAKRQHEGPKATAGQEGGCTGEGQGRFGRQGPENDGVTPDGRRSPIGGRPSGIIQVPRHEHQEAGSRDERRLTECEATHGHRAEDSCRRAEKPPWPRHPPRCDAAGQRPKGETHTVGSTQSGASIQSIVGE